MKTFEANLVCLYKLDEHNVHIRLNLLYLLMETSVIMLIVAQIFRGSRPGNLAWQVKVMAYTKMDTRVLQVEGVGCGAHCLTSCKTLLSRNISG